MLDRVGQWAVGRQRMIRKQSFRGAHQFDIAAQRGFAQRAGGRVHEPVGQGIRQPLQHLGRVVTAGEQLLRFRQRVVARGFAVRAQALERTVMRAGGQGFGEARDLQFDDGLGGVGGFAMVAFAISLSIDF